MLAAVRPYATAGIALVGASVLAVAPLASPQIQSQVHDAAVQLTASTGPFQAYDKVFQNTITSLQAIAATAATAGPRPVVTAVLSNQIAAIQDVLALLASSPNVGTANSTAALGALLGGQSSGLVPAFEAALKQVATALTTTVPPLLQAARDDLANADVESAVNNVLLAGVAAVFPLTGLLTPGIDAVAEPLQSLVTAIDGFGALATIAANPLQNVVNVLNALNEPFLDLPGNPTNAVTIVGGLLGPVIQVAGASGSAIQGVIDAAQDGTPQDVVHSVVGAPAVVLDGLLNGGYGPDLQTVIPTALAGIPLVAGGLLSPFGFFPTHDFDLAVTLPGAIPSLQILQGLIADSIKPPVLPAAKDSSLALSATTPASRVPALANTPVARILSRAEQGPRLGGLHLLGGPNGSSAPPAAANDSTAHTSVGEKTPRIGRHRLFGNAGGGTDTASASAGSDAAAGGHGLHAPRAPRHAKAD